MRIYAAYLGKMPHILPHFWLASFPHIFQKKSRYKPVSLYSSRLPARVRNIVLSSPVFGVGDE